LVKRLSEWKKNSLDPALAPAMSFEIKSMLGDRRPQFVGAMVKANFAVCFDAEAESPDEKSLSSQWKS
jgi:hypothetical protein